MASIYARNTPDDLNNQLQLAICHLLTDSHMHIEHDDFIMSKFSFAYMQRLVIVQTTVC